MRWAFSLVTSKVWFLSATSWAFAKRHMLLHSGDVLDHDSVSSSTKIEGDEAQWASVQSSDRDPVSKNGINPPFRSELQTSSCNTQFLNDGTTYINSNFIVKISITLSSWSNGQHSLTVIFHQTWWSPRTKLKWIVTATDHVTSLVVIPNQAIPSG